MASSRTLPRLNNDLVLQQISESEFVVKNRSNRQFFSVGPVEYFLLSYLDGESTRSRLRRHYERKFGEPLDNSDIDEFLQLAASQKFLITDGGEKASTAEGKSADAATHLKADDSSSAKKIAGQSPLFFRVPVVDPNEIMNRVEPAIRWIWSVPFFLFAVSLICLASWISWGNREQLVASAVNAMSWESVLIFMLTVLFATFVHELAHGFTCKHYGGDVHEIGFLFMFFMPCMYCNVSDAWMIPEKSKRLWITAAGAFSDLIMWALAVLVWRVVLPGTLLSQIAFVVLTVCGSRGFLNLNPLLRLDGYYLVSDWLAIPNLRKRALDHWMAHLRWLLWGAERPEAVAHSRTLLIYGLFCWLFALVFLDLIFLRMLKYLGDEFGVIGVCFMTLLLAFAMRRVFKGFFSSEFSKMIQFRKTRTAGWLIVIVAGVATLFLLPIKHYATGEFEVRPGQMFQLHAQVSGYVQRVHVADGTQVDAGTVIAEMSSPDLEAQIITKRDELKEVTANLQKLKLGPRPEQVTEQKKRVERLQEWLEFSLLDLEKARASHKRSLIVLENRVKEFQAELDLAEKRLEQSKKLYQQGALAGAQLRREQVEISTARARVVEAESRLADERELAVRSYEARVISREEELAEAKAALDLLQKGTRKEEIVAEEARLERIEHELKHLSHLKEQLVIKAPVSGFVSTPRMTEKIGQWVPAGILICTIEDPVTSHVEIAISEDRALTVQEGLPVKLKARALPFETFHAKVERISAATAEKDPNQPQSAVIVHCELENADRRLKSGMTGFGRISRGWNTLGNVMLSKCLRYVRTEFWW